MLNIYLYPSRAMFHIHSALLHRTLILVCARKSRHEQMVDSFHSKWNTMHNAKKWVIKVWNKIVQNCTSHITRFPLARFPLTVYPHIVSAETILFWIWKSKGHSTQGQRSQYINVRKLFKGGNYSRAETIWGNTVCDILRNNTKY